MIVDERGIYYDSSRSSDLEWYLNFTVFKDDVIKTSKYVQNQVLELMSMSSIPKAVPIIDLGKDKKIILVVGQSKDDPSLQYGAVDIKGNFELLRIVKESNPESLIVYCLDSIKNSSHLESDIGFEEGDGFIDFLLDRNDFSNVINIVDELHTISSVLGFEALIRGKKVHTYGLPFYAGWGLTDDYFVCSRRNRLLDINQLVAAVLILYPIYIDPVTGDVCDIRTVISILKKEVKTGKVLNLNFSVLGV